MSDRNSLRAKLLKSPSYRKAEIDLDGEKVYIREPSVGESRTLAQKCKLKDGEIDQLEYALRAVLALTCDADGNRVFDDADYDALAAQPVADGVITKLTSAFAELVGGSGDLGKD